MFGFDKPEDGSAERYSERIAVWSAPRPEDLTPRWETDGATRRRVVPTRRGRLSVALALAQHHAWWVFHNCVAHVLIGLVPVRPFFWLHDWSSHRLNHEENDE